MPKPRVRWRRTCAALLPLAAGSMATRARALEDGTGAEVACAPRSAVGRSGAVAHRGRRGRGRGR